MQASDLWEEKKNPTSIIALALTEINKRMWKFFRWGKNMAWITLKKTKWMKFMLIPVFLCALAFMFLGNTWIIFSVTIRCQSSDKIRNSSLCKRNDGAGSRFYISVTEFIVVVLHCIEQFFVSWVCGVNFKRWIRTKSKNNEA